MNSNISYITIFQDFHTMHSDWKEYLLEKEYSFKIVWNNKVKYKRE
jgi:hypothetical protein